MFVATRHQRQRGSRNPPHEPLLGIALPSQPDMQAAIALFGSRPTSALMHLGKFAVKEPHLHRSGPQIELPLDFSHSRLQPTRGADLQLDGSSVLYHFFPA